MIDGRLYGRLTPDRFDALIAERQAKTSGSKQ
jgi:hypothetical protein